MLGRRGEVAMRSAPFAMSLPIRMCRRSMRGAEISTRTSPRRIARSNLTMIGHAPEAPDDAKGNCPSSTRAVAKARRQLAHTSTPHQIDHRQQDDSTKKRYQQRGNSEDRLVDGADPKHKAADQSANDPGDDSEQRPLTIIAWSDRPATRPRHQTS